MAQKDKAAEILAALEARAQAQGLDIVDVEVVGPANHPTVRVRIDVLGEGTIDMDEVCARTPWVSEVLEELDPFPGAWELEVSSPGLDRPLRRACDFARFIGERAEVRATRQIDGRGKGTGTIVGIEGDVVTLDVDGTGWQVPLADIARAQLKPDFEKIFAAAKKASGKPGATSADEDEDLGEDADEDAQDGEE